MKAALIVLLVVVVIAVLVVAMHGATVQDADLRTFVFVRGPSENIAGAEVVFVRGDGERWLFPYTNEGGWTKRWVPDGTYRVTVSAAGWKTRVARVKVPAGDVYPHRTYIVHLEPVE